jgi:hypothetical protein
VSKEVLVAPCPICGQSALAGDRFLYQCDSCGTRVEQKRWLGITPRDRFFFQAVSTDYHNAEADLLARPFTRTQLTELAGSCYTDADLSAIASGDFSRLQLPSSTVAEIMFPQSHETCYLQVNDLVRAEGPPLSEGVNSDYELVDRRNLTILDQGNLFISDQRLIFPSDYHTIIRTDRKLIGVNTFADAVAVQRKGEDKATYFLGFESRSASLVLAYLQGRLDHLR